MSYSERISKLSFLSGTVYCRLSGVRVIRCEDYPECGLFGARVTRCADCPFCGLSGGRITHCVVGGVRHPQHTQTGFNSSTTAAGNSTV